MLKKEIELVKVLSRIIAKEEIAAMPKPDDPLKNIESLIKVRVDEAVLPLIREIRELERKLQALAMVSKERKGGR